MIKKDKSIVEVFIDAVVEYAVEDLQEILDLLSDNMGDDDE